MRIFLKSHTYCSSRISFRKNEGKGERGFTLIELLISIGIIGIITAIVLLKYTSFDSTTLLKGAAYEVALTLREAQVKSVSVLRSDRTTLPDGTADPGGFNYPYGVTFKPNQKTYSVFRFTDISALSPGYKPFYKVSEHTQSEIINDITLDRGIYIKDICVIDSTNTPICSGNNITQLDISFRRPEFDALFFAHGYKGSLQTDMQNISKVQIKIGSTNNSTSNFVIEITRLGQVTIEPA